MEKEMEKVKNIISMVNLKFKGEYLNNKKYIGTWYDISGNIIYTLNNNINGKGKEYKEEGKLKFEGEFLNGKRNGKCK